MKAMREEELNEILEVFSVAAKKAIQFEENIEACHCI